MKTILTYKLNGTNYSHTFSGRVSYGTVERYLIVEKRIGRSQHYRTIIDIQNLLD